MLWKLSKVRLTRYSFYQQGFCTCQLCHCINIHPIPLVSNDIVVWCKCVAFFRHSQQTFHLHWSFYQAIWTCSLIFLCCRDPSSFHENSGSIWPFEWRDDEISDLTISSRSRSQKYFLVVSVDASYGDFAIFIIR